MKNLKNLNYKGENIETKYLNNTQVSKCKE